LLLTAPLCKSIHHLLHPNTFAGASLFAVGKNQYQREALLHIQNNVRPGDAVYVYWNFSHAYRFYKHSYRLNLPAVEAADRRYSANGVKAYNEVIQNDINRLKKEKRVWLIYNVGFMASIGDIEGKPEWYVEANDKVAPKMMVHNLFLENWRESASYHWPDVHVSLFQNSQ
jgi:hypothetical protein